MKERLRSRARSIAPRRIISCIIEADQLGAAESMLEEFGLSLYCVDGPDVSFFGFPYPTRMAAVRLSNGKVWIWSPIALTDELASAVEAIGPVSYIVSPNKLHHLFLQQWAERWPDARLFAPPGLARKRPEMRFDDELADLPPPCWAADIDQVIFRGSFAMEEVVFFHRPSSTAIVCDLIQRFHPPYLRGFKGLLMKLDGLAGQHGSTPREWRASFLRRKPARAARRKLLGWQPQQLLIAHGKCEKANAAKVLEDALSWI
ncbi:DUF4336 domain-containing protein [Novosphingobium sp. PY1]|uniref:DUF4336 domain-containing protein n=1 Tax=Novosphingobium sp. PY1 TaxID=1882221 RepID=UPI001F5C4C1A|nr:DUF4336 domain-containing protein [Novosphingobium sp. PY1]